MGVVPGGAGAVRGGHSAAGRCRAAGLSSAGIGAGTAPAAGALRRGGVRRAPCWPCGPGASLWGTASGRFRLFTQTRKRPSGFLCLPLCSCWGCCCRWPQNSASRRAVPAGCRCCCGCVIFRVSLPGSGHYSNGDAAASDSGPVCTGGRRPCRVCCRHWRGSSRPRPALRGWPCWLCWD